MRYLKDKEADTGVVWMHKAASVAKSALCLKARCGTVIVHDGEVIGEGYNAPPRDDTEDRKCLDAYDFSGKPRYDHTCCMHAEWRAILDAVRTNPEKVSGSQLYFVRIGEEGSPKRSGKPYCTICSRLALDVGISEFLLWHDDGICAYPTDEYNRLSYEYRVSE